MGAGIFIPPIHSSTGSLTLTFLIFKQGLQFFMSLCEIGSGDNCAEFAGYVTGNSSVYKPVQVWLGIRPGGWLYGRRAQVWAHATVQGETVCLGQRVYQGEISVNQSKAQEMPRYQRGWQAGQGIWSNPETKLWVPRQSARLDREERCKEGQERQVKKMWLRIALKKKRMKNIGLLF